MTTAPSSERPRVLLVDDDPRVLQVLQRTLAESYELDEAHNGRAALEKVAQGRYDTVVVDLLMPELDGLGFLQAVREVDADLPVMLVSGSATLDRALQALEFGAFRFLTKPLDIHQVRGAVAYGVRLARMGRVKREALAVLEAERLRAREAQVLGSQLDDAVGRIFMAWQPIVSWTERRVVAFEALVRSEAQALPNPHALFDAAERLGRVGDLSRAIRRTIAATAPSLPTDAQLYVNLHPHDLDDDELFHVGAPLSSLAHRVVFELSERATLEHVHDARPRIGILREMGFRIALDDLGAGHAGLSTFTVLEPDIVKLDMSLVRAADTSPTKQKLIRAMVSLCHELRMTVIVEGVETAAERDACLGSGADLFQGFLFGRPSRTPEPARWG